MFVHQKEHFSLRSQLLSVYLRGCETTACFLKEHKSLRYLLSTTLQCWTSLHKLTSKCDCWRKCLEVYFKTQCDFTLLPSAGRRDGGRWRKSGGSRVSHVSSLQTALYNLGQEPESMFDMTVSDRSGRAIRLRHTDDVKWFPKFSHDADLMEKFLIAAQVHYWFRLSRVNPKPVLQSDLLSSSEKGWYSQHSRRRVLQSILQTWADPFRSCVLHCDLVIFPTVKCFCVFMMRHMVQADYVALCCILTRLCSI